MLGQINATDTCLGLFIYGTGVIVAGRPAYLPDHIKACRWKFLINREACPKANNFTIGVILSPGIDMPRPWGRQEQHPGGTASSRAQHGLPGAGGERDRMERKSSAFAPKSGNK